MTDFPIGGAIIFAGAALLILAAVLHYRKERDERKPVPVTPTDPVTTTPETPPFVPDVPPRNDTPPTPPPASNPVEFDMLHGYIDRDDLMKAIGAAKLTQQVRIDGAIFHNGFGPGIDFYTWPNGNLRTDKPATVQPPNIPPRPPVFTPSPPPLPPVVVPGPNSRGAVRLWAAVGNASVLMTNSRAPQWVVFNTERYTIGKIGVVGSPADDVSRTLSLHTSPTGAPETMLGPSRSGITGSVDWYADGRMPPSPFYATLKPNTDYFLCITCARDGGTMLVEHGPQYG